MQYSKRFSGAPREGQTAVGEKKKAKKQPATLPESIEEGIVHHSMALQKKKERGTVKVFGKREKIGEGS